MYIISSYLIIYITHYILEKQVRLLSNYVKNEVKLIGNSLNVIVADDKDVNKTNRHLSHIIVFLA